MFGQYSITKECFDYTCSLAGPQGTVLEFGSGYSTEAFVANGLKVFSVEHDPEYINKVTGATYIPARISLYKRPSKRMPHQSGWYMNEDILKGLPESYDVILVDGPPRTIGRMGFAMQFDVLNLKHVPIVFDDMQRWDDYLMALTIAKKYGKDLTIKGCDGLKQWGILIP